MWHLYSRLFFDPIEGLFCKLKYQFSHSKWLLFSSTDGHTDQVIALETLLFTLFVVAKICKKEKAIFMFHNLAKAAPQRRLFGHIASLSKRHLGYGN